MISTALQFILAPIALVLSSSILSVGSVTMVNATTARLFDKLPSTTGGTRRYVYVSNEAQRLRDKIENYPNKLRKLYVMSILLLLGTVATYVLFTPEMHRDFANGFAADLLRLFCVENIVATSERLSEDIGADAVGLAINFGFVFGGYVVFQVTRIFYSYVCVLRDF